MKVAVFKESFPGERRVALTPASAAQLLQQHLEVWIETGAGAEAGYPDALYREKGVRVVEQRGELFEADILLQVRCLGANPVAGQADVEQFGDRHFVVGMCDPLGSPQSAQKIAQTGATLFALELLPRITRAQSMDVLSSMATIAGYRAVLLAAVELPKMFPLMMTAAGTLTAARALVIGAGVAGLQAIATARRLGAVVQAYDVRPACREQVESLGARFVELDLSTETAEDAGGYAKALGEEFYQQQRAQLANYVADNDVVITTAAIPGKPSPLLITDEAVSRMAPGSVIVDLAAERGGNCQLSQMDQRVVSDGVVILGPSNLIADVPYHASQMYSNNITKFLLNLLDDGRPQLNLDDQIIVDTLVARDGEVVHDRLRDLLGLDPLYANIDAESTDGGGPAGTDESSENASAEPVVHDSPQDADDAVAEARSSDTDSAAAGSSNESVGEPAAADDVAGDAKEEAGTEEAGTEEAGTEEKPGDGSPKGDG